MLLTVISALSNPVADLGAEISPMSKPDLEGAKAAMQNLNKLAEGQSGIEKVRTQRLATVIKNLFTAEFRVSKQLEAQEKAEQEAVRLEKSADTWEIPNAFGNTNPTAARDLRHKAGEMRATEAQLVAARQRDLLVQLKEAESTLHDFHKSEDFGVVILLSDAVRAINDRSMPAEDFNPAFSESAVAGIREFMSKRSEWLIAAKDAESAANYEEAIRNFTKAKNLEGRKRCAMSLAQELEKSGVYGSAIEYFEVAGDFKKAGQLRADHPDLRAESFKQLDAEDLFAKVAPSCVRIYNGKGRGSGFFFRQGGYILTNGHVVSAAGSITVKLDDDRSFEAKLVAKGEALDLAIVKIELEEHDLVNFRTGLEVRIGLPVSLLGYPEVDLPTATMNSGRISNTKRVFMENPVYQLDVSANHGNSGGPVIDGNGRLVGILTFGFNDFDKDRFNFAITAEAAQEFVKKSLDE
ncbi:MAG: S1C family serine protease [Akkermansiaceae bacterium]|nr:S1C family serine protease [Akkermansiaceae bacterium]MDP4848238.1 S1C family serine protease [Akkermansiaceae bacterium]